MIHDIGNTNIIYEIKLVSDFSTDTYLIKGSLIDIINLLIDNKNIYSLNKFNKINNEQDYISECLDKIKFYNNKISTSSKKFSFLGGLYNKFDHEIILIEDNSKKKKIKKKNFFNCFCKNYT